MHSSQKNNYLPVYKQFVKKNTFNDIFVTSSTNPLHTTVYQTLIFEI